MLQSWKLKKAPCPNSGRSKKTPCAKAGSSKRHPVQRHISSTPKYGSASPPPLRLATDKQSVWKQTNKGWLCHRTFSHSRLYD